MLGARGRGGAQRAPAARRPPQNDVAEELELRHKAALPPPDLTRYLQPVGMMEARYVRMLSSLCAQTYFMNKLTVRPGVAWHGRSAQGGAGVCMTCVRPLAAAGAFCSQPTGSQGALHWGKH